MLVISEWGEMPQIRGDINVALNPRFQVRETQEGLEELDIALLKMGYVFGDNKPDRAGWYNEMKRNIIRQSKKEGDE